MSVAVATDRRTASVPRPIRVMIVDDSIVVRRLLTRWIEAEPDMTVAGSMCSGRAAVDGIDGSAADVAVLDIDMTELDGLSALPLLLAKKPDLAIIMASTHTRRSAEISLQALARGAADYVPKPGSSLGSAGSAEFHRELIDKIRSLGRRRVVARTPASAPPTNQGLTLTRLAAVMRRTPASPFSLRPFSVAMPRALLIGASTGGPQALNDLIGNLGGVFDRVPILIVQHMPSTFTTVLAEHLTRRCGRRVHEAEHGEPVIAGEVYLAAGGRHMRVAPGPRGPVIALGDDPPIHFCRPAVDPLLRSAASVWGGACVALILTGMGTDGAGGAADIVAAGGSIIAQDEATSVVWGMPRAVAQAGLCSLVLPLGEIATTINQLFSGVRL